MPIWSKMLVWLAFFGVCEKIALIKNVLDRVKSKVMVDFKYDRKRMSDILTPSTPIYDISVSHNLFSKNVFAAQVGPSQENFDLKLARLSEIFHELFPVFLRYYFLLELYLNLQFPLAKSERFDRRLGKQIKFLQFRSFSLLELNRRLSLGESTVFPHSYSLWNSSLHSKGK